MYYIPYRPGNRRVDPACNSIGRRRRRRHVSPSDRWTGVAINISLCVRSEYTTTGGTRHRVRTACATRQIENNRRRKSIRRRVPTSGFRTGRQKKKKPGRSLHGYGLRADSLKTRYDGARSRRGVGDSVWLKVNLVLLQPVFGKNN